MLAKLFEPEAKPAKASKVKPAAKAPEAPPVPVKEETPTSTEVFGPGHPLLVATEWLAKQAGKHHVDDAIRQTLYYKGQPFKVTKAQHLAYEILSLISLTEDKHQLLKELSAKTK